MKNTIFLIACLCTTAALGDDLLVQLPFGTVRGRDRGTYYTFESIPYALPPVGPLRFEPPQPFIGEWRETFDATKPAVECLQWSHFVTTPDQLTGSEDCLTVSIFKPKNASRLSFPVVVNIFGGAWSFGGSVQDGAREFMESGNVIVAKINHRVGILGFASTGDAHWSGNYALKDQRLALQWIKKYISFFGGDPTNILLLGFSSGAASVHFQMLHEDMADIKGVYSLGGNSVAPWAVQPSPREQTYELGRLFGCGTPRSTAVLKECLKAVNGIDLVRAFKNFLLFNYVPFAPFSPVLEPEDTVDPFITKMPIDIIKSGKFAQIPWLMAYCQDEGIYNAALLLTKLAETGKERLFELNSQWYELAPYFFSYRNTLNKRERDARSRRLKLQYLGTRNFTLENYFDVQRMFTNEMFKNSFELGVDLQRTYGKSPVYTYIYDNPATQSIGQLIAGRTDLVLGTAHGDDYFLMMNNNIREPLRADEKLISWKLVKMVEGFLETGQFVYDNCVFQDNVGKKHFEVVVIQRTKCTNLQADRLPDAVSDHKPKIPIIPT